MKMFRDLRILKNSIALTSESWKNVYLDEFLILNVHWTRVVDNRQAVTSGIKNDRSSNNLATREPIANW